MHEFLWFIGRFHVLALHLPIGIAAVTLLLDLLSRRQRHRHLQTALPLLWGATALTALVTVVLGLLHASEGGFEGPALAAHRLYGSSVAVLATLVWLVCVFHRELYRSAGHYGGVLVLLLITLTGHFGGNLTHGDTYLVQYAPQVLRNLAGLPPRRAPVTAVGSADPWYDLVGPLLQARCGTCHNANKRNGELDLSTHASALAGGKSGRSIVPGTAADSVLYQRITLPASHEDFMPAEGRTPLTDRQQEIVRWWINAQAPVDTAIATLAPTAELLVLLNAELGLAAPEAPLAATTLAPDHLQLLHDAGFLVRQVAQNAPGLVVSINSVGANLDAARLRVLRSIAPDISELDLHGSGIDDALLATLPVLPQLARLQLADNGITDQGLATLADSFPALAWLNLSGNPGITDAGLEGLARLPALTSVYLWRTAVTAAALQRLQAARPALVFHTGIGTAP